MTPNVSASKATEAAAGDCKITAASALGKANVASMQMMNPILRGNQMEIGLRGWEFNPRLFDFGIQLIVGLGIRIGVISLVKMMQLVSFKPDTQAFVG